MIKVAFLLNYPTSYNGAINYFRNLFYAIDKYLVDEINVVLFVPDNLAKEYIDIFEPYVEIVKTNVLRRKSPLWLIDKISEKTLNVNPLLDKLLLDNGIEVVSHSSFISKRIPTINWIMDFQHLHFPELWTTKELKETKKFLNRLIVQSDRIFLSSYSALDDFKIDYKQLDHKTNVLHFVCQPKGELKIVLNNKEEEILVQKYSINRPFFYLPNQFWSHKNHGVVFKAVKILIEKGYNPLLITSGLMNDFRSKNNHVEDLKNYVQINGLQDNIFFLGLIPYADVLNLMTLSTCMINPSFFEGWSSTVEESKTMGKRLILSDIKVHKEQAPELGTYFNPNSVTELADAMEKILVEEIKKMNLGSLIDDLNLRTEKFARDYFIGIKQLLSEKSA